MFIVLFECFSIKLIMSIYDVLDKNMFAALIDESDNISKKLNFDQVILG